MSPFDDIERTQDAVRSGFGGAPVLVVGDVMLDRYLWGEVKRISPEAPVPVVHVQRETLAAGGAANVALNLAGLGLQVTLAGFTGHDNHRRDLLALLDQAGIDTSAIVIASDRSTTVKTRIIGGHQQMLRLDVEHGTDAPAADIDRLLEAVTHHIDAMGAVVLSDYAKGTLPPRVCQTIIRTARRHGIPVLADPKGRDYARYASATTLSPNRAELAVAIGMSASDLDALLIGGQHLRASLGLDYLTVTRSEQGITLIEPDQIHHVPATAREVFDVSGAGDTVIATLAAGTVAGLSRMDSIRLANLAAGIVCGKVGTAPVERAELLAELESRFIAPILTLDDKIVSLDVLTRRVEAWRTRGETIVFTNGCFDLLHAGHVIYLERARREGDRLILGLNTDDSVRRLKGPARPILSQRDRARVLAALTSVDAVVLFDEDTPLHLIHALRPDVLAKGADYTEDQVVGAREVKSWGGRVALIPYVEGFSTSGIIRRIEAGEQ